MARAVLVFELTRLDLEIAKDGTRDSVKRKYEESVFNASLVLPDQTYKEELAKVRKCISDQAYAVIDCLRHEAQIFLFRDDDIVVILGDDGAFVNIAKLLQNQKVITVSTATRNCGRLMKCTVDSFEKSAALLFSNKAECIRVSIAKAVTSLGHTLEAVNDFFVGRADLRSSRYSILTGADFLSQVSSGVIVSTGTGSTGWEKSVRANDSEYHERGLDDSFVSVVTRELCSGDRVGILRSKSVTFRSDDDGTRVVSDGVLNDSGMLLLPAGTTVTITSNMRSIRLCVG